MFFLNFLIYGCIKCGFLKISLWDAIIMPIFLGYKFWQLHAGWLPFLPSFYHFIFFFICILINKSAPLFFYWKATFFLSPWFITITWSKTFPRLFIFSFSSCYAPENITCIIQRIQPLKLKKLKSDFNIYNLYNLELLLLLVCKLIFP